MLKVNLMSMPYTILNMPSISTAQIVAVVRKYFKDEVKIDTAHGFLDFAEFVGPDNYNLIGTFEGKALNDWLFRQAAFDSEDNLDRYKEFFFVDGKFPRKVRIFDFILEKRQQIRSFLDGLIERYKLDECDIVGFTSMMSQNVASLALARRLKEINSDIITVMGGANCEHPMGKTLVDAVSQIDYVFSGEGLVSFQKFLKAVINEDFDSIYSIQGIHARQEYVHKKAVGAEGFVALGGIPVTQDKQVATSCGGDLEINSGETFNLNEMPMLDYTEYLSRIEESPYKEDLKKDLILPFQTSTGCWWADKITCSFCGLTPHSFRQMTSEKAKNYINALLDKYSGSCTVFEAVDPCMPEEYPTEVFPYIDTTDDSVLQYEVRANVSEQDMQAMADAKVLLPQPGIESLSTKTLKFMRKGITGFQNVLFLKRCAEKGLYPIWNYLYGLPNEGYDEFDSDKLLEDLKTLSHLPPPASAVSISFQRYSEYYNDAEDYDLNLVPADYYYYVYPFTDEQVHNIAYTFGDPKYFENYFRKYKDIVQAFNLEIVSWMYKFRDNVPMLYFKEDFVVYDSRFEKPLHYKINPLEKDILSFLNTPATFRQLCDKFDLSKEELRNTINSFLKARFLFEEKDKFISVVCDKCLLTSENYKKYFVEFVSKNAVAFD